jgi:aspartate racemase
MYSVNFAEVERYQHAGAWDKATALMLDAADRLERGGAELLLICSNTMHKMAVDLEQVVSLPLLHIADPTAERIRAHGIKRVGLLGTAFTMEQDFYKGRLADKHSLEVLVPGAEDRRTTHRVIYDELVQGRTDSGSKANYVRIINDLVARGAEGIILGCTEIMLLVGQADSPIPVFDTNDHSRGRCGRVGAADVKLLGEQAETVP